MDSLKSPDITTDTTCADWCKTPTNTAGAKARCVMCSVYHFFLMNMFFVFPYLGYMVFGVQLVDRYMNPDSLFCPV